MALIEIDGPVEQKVLAGLLGISESRVSELIGRGVLRPGETAREQLHAILGHLRAVAAGRQDDETVVAERRRLLRARADSAELEARERAGDLVRRLDVEAAMAAKLAGARDMLLGLADRMTPVLAAESDIGKVHELITGEIRRAMRAIGRDTTASGGSNGS